jgi:erythromycin esterase-like protein
MESRLAIDLVHALVPLKGSVRDDETLFGMVGDAPVVLVGEATHGTHEFYRARAEITKRLIADHGFTAVCIEGDWPDAYRVNRFVRGTADDAEAVESLAGFKRFPAWMWRNVEVLDFIAWLRDYNDRAPAMQRPKTGFYGLDLYSTYASIEAVLSYLDAADPQEAVRARRRYESLQPFESQPERYGLAAEQGAHPICRDDVVAELLEIQRKAFRYTRLDGRVAADQYFYAEQNARVVGRAEEYYRAMLDDSASTWNLRDTHMLDTLERLMTHLSAYQGRTKAVVWAHNSHVGNADATSMAMRNETNIGALARRRFGDRAVSIGFTTYTGTVTAAPEWHAAEERKRIVPARGDSYEYLFHATNVPRFLVPLRTHRPKLAGLPQQARQRAIGVIYRPETGLYSHYFTARLIDQFDALYHFDVTRALEPFERSVRSERGELPEGYPTGL